MYEPFYGFSEKPFNTTPNPKFFFPSVKHTEALNSLVYSINERKGFVVITGEIGSGKTTVTRALLNRLDPNTRTALITNTHLTSKELIAQVLEEFEIEHHSGGKQKMLSLLNNFLIQQLTNDVNIVLLIDEAQNLTPTVLEEVRMLSNLETDSEKLIQIILLGQPQLRKKLEHPRLEQFKQRIALYYHICALDKNETCDYILHRMKVVSTNGIDVFTPEAIDAIYNYSGGIPRLINLVCDSALLSGYVYETKRITRKIVNEAIRERDITVNTDNSIIFDAKNAQLDVPEAVQIFCCDDCAKFTNCETKWQRGLKGEEQSCCEKCQSYQRCVDNSKKSKLN